MARAPSGGRPANEQPNGQKCDCPTMIHFYKCDALQVSGTQFINSPQIHISIYGCQSVNLGNLRIFAPENSPNTDGIDVGSSSNVDIHDSQIGTGDDCVAITGGTNNISVTNVLCGPGHGISIGSLGRDGYSTVENIIVRQCNLTGTQNGVRIKTVPNGSGYAKGILFENIYLDNVRNPIIIDQNYCDNTNININRDCPEQPKAEAVQVSDVTYNGIYGSSASKQAITLSCSENVNCNGIVTNRVGITGEDVYASCQNAHGNFIETSPEITCN
ncbi:probable polygalacturonase At3g15720 [Rutidosis leptorrhynchoides]|uniref:probable polygalacturonase At3g15720 n=1 Tax=Rutidosis leptorrhynchoides TaxID=125765 RepID=UPI003A997DF7